MTTYAVEHAGRTVLVFRIDFRTPDARVELGYANGEGFRRTPFVTADFAAHNPMTVARVLNGWRRGWGSESFPAGTPVAELSLRRVTEPQEVK